MQSGFDALRKSIPSEEFDRLSALHRNSIAAFNALLKQLAAIKANPKKYSSSIEDYKSKVQGLKNKIKGCKKNLEELGMKLTNKDKEIEKLKKNALEKLGEYKRKKEKEIEECKESQYRGLKEFEPEYDIEQYSELDISNIVSDENFHTILDLYSQNQALSVIDKNELIKSIKTYADNKIRLLYFPMMSIVNTEKNYNNLLNFVKKQIIFEVKKGLDAKIDAFEGFNQTIPDSIQHLGEAYKQDITKNISTLKKIKNRISGLNFISTDAYIYHDLISYREDYDLINVAALFINKLKKKIMQPEYLLKELYPKTFQRYYTIISLFPFTDKNYMDNFFEEDFSAESQIEIENLLKLTNLSPGIIKSYEDLMKYAIFV